MAKKQQAQAPEAVQIAMELLREVEAYWSGVSVRSSEEILAMIRVYLAPAPPPTDDPSEAE
jgi:hypothetical protein